MGAKDMSEFSDLLGKVIKENNLSIYNLAKVIDCDRSWLQKVMSGDRHMNFQNFMPLYNYLRQIEEPRQLRLLLNKFMLDYFGEREFYIISYIKTRLEQMADTERYILGKGNKEIVLEDYCMEYSLKNEKCEIIKRIFEMIHCEESFVIDKNDKMKLYVHIPASWDYLRNFLLLFLNKDSIKGSIEFKYIMPGCSNGLDDISMIENYLTACEFALYGYDTYDLMKLELSYSENNLLPYYVMTTNEILMISEDGTIMFGKNDSELVGKLRSRFEQAGTTDNSFLKEGNLLSYSMYFVPDNTNMSFNSSISNNLYIEIFFTKEILKEIISDDLAEKNYIVNMLSNHYENSRKNNISMYFTIESLNKFLKEEDDYMEGEFHFRISKKSRRKIAEAIYNYYDSTKAEIHLINTDRYRLHSKLNLVMLSEKLIMSSGKKYSDNRAEDIKAFTFSPTVVRHMSNFSIYFMNSDMCMSKENSLKIYKDIMDSLTISE